MDGLGCPVLDAVFMGEPAFDGSGLAQFVPASSGSGERSHGGDVSDMDSDVG